MARWTTQNKIRPGSYLNFKSVSQSGMTVGDRGIGMLAMSLSWGPEDTLIDVYSTELSDGSSLAKVGLTAFDADAKTLNLMLSNCYLARVYRLDTGGEKASGSIGNLTAIAKYAGTKGNTVTITVEESDAVYTVTTWVGGSSKNAQAVATISELASNDFVDFSGDGELTIHAGMKLVGGTDGAVDLATAYPAWLALARKSRWQTMALTKGNDTYGALFAKFAEDMRDTEGRYVQVVLANYTNADYHGVINSDCGAIVNGVTVPAEEATAWVAGITAGASITQSNVGKIFAGATRILNERTDTEIAEALKRGMFILSTNQGGEIVVEDDINSLHTFTDELSDDFRLNQIIRVLDEMGTKITDTWEQSFKGKVQNNENGRDVFKSALLSYFNELENLGAIENFGGADALVVEAGTSSKDSVTLTVNELDPVAAMSKLYGILYVI